MDFKKIEKNIKKEIKKFKLDFVLNYVEKRCLKATSEMEKNGFKIDKKLLEKISRDFAKKISSLESKIFEISDEVFNIKSTQQLSKILFEKLLIPTKGLKKTPKGVISTAEPELEKIKNEHKIIPLILEYRELTKLTTTYTDNLKKMIDKKTERIFARFLQNGTSTGRMSSRDPNLQNIPVGGNYGKKIREFFVTEKNFSLYSFDYSQIELRLAAILSKDKKMIKAFSSGADFHSEVAKEVFGEENQETRRKAKVINFGILYGMGPSALRKNLGGEISLDEARKYLDNYFEKFSGLANFLEETKKKVTEKGYSETFFGRVRFFPEINSKIPFLKAMAERTAINAPVQGSAADVVKIAMGSVYEFLEKENLLNDIKILVQVHDELIFEIKDSVSKKNIEEIENIMENVFEEKEVKKYLKENRKISKIPISLKVEKNMGKSWVELK